MGWVIPARVLQVLAGIGMAAVAYNEQNDRDLDEEVWWKFDWDLDDPDQRVQLILGHGDTNEMTLATP